MTDTSEETGTPHPPARRGRLNTTTDVRRQLARLYFDLRQGVVDSKTAGTGAYVLSVLLKAVEIDVIDRRIAALEERANANGGIAR